LDGRGVAAVELDATFGAASLYRRLGFQDKYLSLRFYREGSSTGGGEAPRVSSTVHNSILAFDYRMTGISRSRVLKSYFEGSSGIVITEYSNILSAYAFVRPRAYDCLAVGPLVADSDQAAGGLLDRIMARFGHRSLETGVPESNRTAVQLLRERNFLYRQPSLRMYRGKAKENEDNIYAIFSPEKG